MSDFIKFSLYNAMNKEPCLEDVIKPYSQSIYLFEDEESKKKLLAARRFEYLFKMDLTTFMDLYVQGSVVVKKYNRLEIEK